MSGRGKGGKVDYPDRVICSIMQTIELLVRRVLERAVPSAIVRFFATTFKASRNPSVIVFQSTPLIPDFASNRPSVVLPAVEV